MITDMQKSFLKSVMKQVLNIKFSIYNSKDLREEKEKNFIVWV